MGQAFIAQQCCCVLVVSNASKRPVDELQSFRDFLFEDYGNDFDKAFQDLSFGKAYLTKTQFARLAKRVGYAGNVEALFELLDADGSGKICAIEFRAMQYLSMPSTSNKKGAPTGRPESSRQPSFRRSSGQDTKDRPLRKSSVKDSMDIKEFSASECSRDCSAEFDDVALPRSALKSGSEKSNSLERATLRVSFIDEKSKEEIAMMGSEGTSVCKEVPTQVTTHAFLGA